MGASGSTAVPSSPSWDAHRERGNLNLKVGDFDAAIRSYSAAVETGRVEVSQTRLGLMWLCAAAHERLGKESGARRLPSDVMRHIGSYASPRRSSVASLAVALCNRSEALCLSGGGAELALADAVEACRIAPGYAKAWYRRGACLAVREEYEGGALALRRALALDPDNVEYALALDAALHASRGADSSRPFDPTLRGAVLTFGVGRSGALGRGSCLRAEEPKPVDELRGVDVVDVSCGAAHTVAVAADGAVYAWGDRRAIGSGKHVDLVPSSSPRLVRGLSAHRVVAVACGGAHAVAVSRGGVALAFGCGGLGQLGGASAQHPEVHVEGPSSAGASRIIRFWATGAAAGATHSVVWGADGTAYGFGGNRFGQLGVHDLAATVPTPTKLRDAQGAVVLVDTVACGAGHTVLVERGARSVLAAGCDSCGQLGRNTVDDLQGATFDRLPHLPEPPVAVAAGEQTTHVVTRRRVYGCGLNVFGQVGIGSRDAVIPTLTKLPFDGHDITHVAAARNRAVAVNAAGDVYAWGLPFDRHLDHADQETADAMQAVVDGTLDADGPSLGASLAPDLVGLHPSPLKKLAFGRSHYVLLEA